MASPRCNIASAKKLPVCLFSGRLSVVLRADIPRTHTSYTSHTSDGCESWPAQVCISTKEDNVSNCSYWTTVYNTGDLRHRMNLTLGFRKALEWPHVDITVPTRVASTGCCRSMRFDHGERSDEIVVLVQRTRNMLPKKPPVRQQRP